MVQLKGQYNEHLYEHLVFTTGKPLLLFQVLDNLNTR